MKHKLFTVLFALALSLSCALGFSACEIFGGGWAENQPSNNTVDSSDDKSQDSVNEPQDIYTGTPTPVSLLVRTNTVTITDSGRSNQQMDKVCFSDYYKASALNNAGYTKLKVTLTIDVREIEDGYQYIFLYYNSECKGNNILDKIVDIVYDEDPSLLDYWKFEHTAGAKDTSWQTYTFTTSLQMSKIKDDLYIRYGASGNNEDDWQNKNVSIVLEPLKP